MKKELPKGIKLLAWATSIRWFGWGFFEALLPIFLFYFAHTYAETGILASTYDILFLLALPIVGILADSIASRTIIIIGLLTYPFISMSYFFAGITGLALLVVIAKGLNGIGYAFDGVGRNTYIRRHSPPSKVSSAFGYTNMVTHLGWLLAVFASLFIVKFVKINWLFLAIIPTVLITLFMVRKLEIDKKENLKDGFRKSFKKGFYLGMFKEIKDWDYGLKLMGLITFFIGFIAVFAELFIPIYSYTHGSNLQEVILITILLNTPMLFGTILGKMADKNRNKGIFVGLIMTIALLILLSFMNTYVWQLIVAFGIGIALHLMELAGDGISTHLSRRSHYGRISSAMEGIGSLGNIAGPIAVGLLIDIHGLPETSLIISGATLILLLIAVFGRKRLSKTP